MLEITPHHMFFYDIFDKDKTYEFLLSLNMIYEKNKEITIDNIITTGIDAYGGYTPKIRVGVIDRSYFICRLKSRINLMHIIQRLMHSRILVKGQSSTFDLVLGDGYKKEFRKYIIKDYLKH